MDIHSDIIDNIINDIKSEHNIKSKDKKLSKDEEWYKHFNSLNKFKKMRLIKLLFRGYCNTIIESINATDDNIHLINIGSLKIKPSRRQYIDLRKEGVEPEEAVKIVKQDFKKLNNIK